MTLLAFYRLNYGREGDAFFDWIVHSTRLTRPELQVVYNVYGEIGLKEKELDFLRGYRDSRPVRIGNGAEKQLQLDVYGAVIDTAFEFSRRDHGLDKAACKMLLEAGETVCKRWREPDEGIWETRLGRSHHTHSKVMCWVALDRLLKLHQDGHMKAPLAKFSAERDAIRAMVESRGFNPAIGSYTSEFGGDQVDISLLLLPLHGYIDANAARMRATYGRIQERLRKNRLFYRYLHHARKDSPVEGAFAVGCFWAVQCRARQGEVAEARQDFEHLCLLANDVGLFAEEIDTLTGAPLGNFPQAYTHIGLINAALDLEEAANAEPR
jgi:GH15 family glucan-1,4-alpha-glucosidase